MKIFASKAILISVAAVALLDLPLTAVAKQMNDSAFQSQQRILMHLAGTGRAVDAHRLQKLIRTAKRAGLQINPVECFEAPLKTLEAGLPLGQGFSCFENVEIIQDGAFFTLRETVILKLKGGIIIVQGDLTGGALLNGDNDPVTGVTHVTGSFPTENNVFGPGAFKNITGRSRVSGGLNIADPELHEFDCILVLDVEAKTDEYH